MSDPQVELVGRSSSHFTRVVAIFAHELGVPFELVVAPSITATDAGAYGGNPALKVPALRIGTSLVFGAENACRKLAALRPAARVVWPEAITADVGRNAQELVWHAMTAQVQLGLGTLVCGLPRENRYFEKAAAGLAGALGWLDAHLDDALALLPSPRDLSVLEVSLFCLVEHLAFRQTLPRHPYPALLAFAAERAGRPSSARTVYRFDT